MSVAFVWNARLEQDLLLLFVETCPPNYVLTSACGEGNTQNEWFEHCRHTLRGSAWLSGAWAAALWCSGPSKLLHFEHRTPDCACVEQSWVCHRVLAYIALIRCDPQPPGKLRIHRHDSGESRTRPRLLGGCMTDITKTYAVRTAHTALPHFCLPAR